MITGKAKPRAFPKTHPYFGHAILMMPRTKSFMGWFIGKAFTTGKKWYHLVGIAIPVLIHTLFDASISATEYDSIYLLLVLLALILNAVLTVVMIVRINRLSKQAGAEKQVQV